MAKLGIRLNLNNGGLTQVRAWKFNSVVSFVNRVWGCSEEGISILGGDTDNGTPIIGKLVTPYHNFTIQHPKRIRKLYLTYIKKGTLQITSKSSTDEEGFITKVKGETPGCVPVPVRLPGHRGHKGTHWQFTITNPDGDDFSIDYLGCLFIPLTRGRGI